MPHELTKLCQANLVAKLPSVTSCLGFKIKSKSGNDQTLLPYNGYIILNTIQTVVAVSIVAPQRCIKYSTMGVTLSLLEEISFLTNGWTDLHLIYS